MHTVLIKVKTQDLPRIESARISYGFKAEQRDETTLLTRECAEFKIAEYLCQNLRFACREMGARVEGWIISSEDEQP